MCVCVWGEREREREREGRRGKERGRGWRLEIVKALVKVGYYKLKKKSFLRKVETEMEVTTSYITVIPYKSEHTHIHAERD